MQQGGCSFKKLADLPPCQRDSAYTDNTAGEIPWPLVVSGEVKCCLGAAWGQQNREPVHPSASCHGNRCCLHACSALVMRPLVLRLWVTTPLHPCIGGSSSRTMKPPSVASGKAATLQNFLVGRRGDIFSHCTLLVETKKQQLSCLDFALGKGLYLLVGILYLLF